MKATIVASVLAGGVAAAQPAPDLARAKSLYQQASAEMKDGRYSDAAKDFGAVYDITHDPVLFYKIAGANQKAGHCDVAVIYYKRYLKDAHPSLDYVKLTEKKIDECGGDKVAPPPPPPVTTPPPPPPVVTPPPPPPPVATASTQRNAEWILVGSSLAMITLGSVLAYSASSSEQDLKDLYVSNLGMPPTYDAKTAQRYQDLIDQGHTYEHLSWAAFGVAGACAIGATILWMREPEVTVAPIATSHEAGVAATMRF